MEQSLERSHNKMDESILKVIARIKVSQDGDDFLNYLKQLSKDNYDGFKRASTEMNDIHKGRALALDALINLFENCELKLQDSTSNLVDWGT